ncbi:MAG: PBSX family phage terminase large subunit [Oscillospiraceae bacterium]|jgi:PBSX family phage terminase large subunit|nr:PBSX family phage terminase large subunit [Oscillospiraceae bacterium]
MTINIDDLLIKPHRTVLLDALRHGHVHYSFCGGRGSAKSSAISVILTLLLTLHSDVHAIVFRKTGNTLRDSVYAQISFALGLLGLDEYFKKTVSPTEMTYLPTGQKILFRGIDEPEKIKSIKAPFGYFGITWFEELDQYNGREEIRSVLQSTMRGRGGRFWNFESFNPPANRNNWVNIDLLTERCDRLISRTSYLDVPPEWLSEQFISEAEALRESNPRSYDHEYLGIATGTGANVFENIKEEPIPQSVIHGFDHVLNGVDWGYYPDPWTFNRAAFDRAGRVLYIFYEDSALKKSPRETAERVRAHVRNGEPVTCDNREENCADYRAFGISARAAVKGPDSRKYSYEWLQSLNAIWIDPERCPRTLREFMQYEYERDRNGEIIPGYPDGGDHHIDAVRYATERIWRRRGQ